MPLEVIIGLEVHAQLLTKSKMFCGCSAAYASAAPNTHVCPVCLGMPGVLPVINRQAVAYTVMTALALHCTIPAYSKFDRKNYPYPDLMKGYQISQYDAPLSRNGWLTIESDGQVRKIRINRVHLEEDTAKLLHRTSPWGERYSLVDVNRSGVPLMEVVSEPDLRSPEEAELYLKKLRSILQYLGVSSGNMEEGSFRCDANISLREVGGGQSFPKAEVKNMNSFRAVRRALEYEVVRQGKVIAEGGTLVQETRGWVEEQGITVSQRSKEYAHDYRYFPEPDLPPLVLSSDWVEEMRRQLPELPDERRQRFMEQYDLPAYDAALLTSAKALADFFEASLADVTPSQRGEALYQRAKATSNWLLGDLAHLLNVTGREMTEVPLRPSHLTELLDLLEAGTISGPTAKALFEEAFHTGQSPKALVTERGLTQIGDADVLERVVRQVLEDNPQAIADYRKGKEQALTFLVGQVMRTTKGRAKPAMVHQLLKERLHQVLAES